MPLAKRRIFGASLAVLLGGKVANQDEPDLGQIIKTLTKGGLKGLNSSNPVVGDVLLSGMDA